MKVSLIQMTSGIRVDANIAQASALIRQAAAASPDLIATPEMTGLLDKRPGEVERQAQAEDSDAAVASFSALAAELGTSLLIGSLAIRTAGNKIVNRSFLFDTAGRIAARYDKIHMFDVDLDGGESYRESATYLPGGAAVLTDCAGTRLGLTICYDVRFPHLYRSLATAGARVITVPAAFTATTGRAHWHVLLRARAIETGCFILAPAQCGHHEDGRDTYGHSLIVSPWGDVLADGGTEPGVVTATLALGDVEVARSRVPSLVNGRAFNGP